MAQQQNISASSTFLPRLTTGAAQSIKLSMPIASALKYELHHGIFPTLVETLKAHAPTMRQTNAMRELEALRRLVSDPKEKVRLVSALLASISVSLLAQHSIEVDAATFDEVMVSEFDGLGENVVRAAMVRSLVSCILDPVEENEHDENEVKLRNRQVELVRNLYGYGTSLLSFSAALPLVEQLIDRFWSIEARIDVLRDQKDQTDQTDWPGWQYLF